MLSQTIWRIREPTWQGSCPAQKATFEGPPQFRPGPCQQLATEPGPFVPNDVDRGRVVAIGDNALVVLDSNGARLLTIPIKAAAAQLSGSDLVVLVQGQLRRHDAETGALVNSWQVPDVRSAGPCEEDYVCNSIQLRLQDTTHGLVAYLLDGNLHLLRLSDGADAILHNATAARFSATGLFYAYQAPNPWQGRIRFLAYEQLPLR